MFSRSLPPSPVQSRIFSPCQISGRIPGVVGDDVNFRERESGTASHLDFPSFLPSCVRKRGMNAAAKFRSMNGKKDENGAAKRRKGGTHLCGQCRRLLT